MFYFIGWAPQEADAEINIQKPIDTHCKLTILQQIYIYIYKDSETSIHLGSEGNSRGGAGTCDKEEDLSKPAITVGGWGLIPPRQLRHLSELAHSGMRELGY